MTCPELFTAGEPVWLIVQNKLQKGFVVRTLCDGIDVRIEVATMAGRIATWCVPVDRVATRLDL